MQYPCHNLGTGLDFATAKTYLKSRRTNIKRFWRELVVEGETPTPATPLANDAPSHDLISPRNRGVMLRWLEGQSIEDIANRLHLPVERVQRVLKLRAVKEEITRLQQLTNDEWVKDRIATLAHEAIDTVRDVMRGEITNELRFKAAKELLDKTPVLRPPKDGIGKAIGEGIGDAIINRLAQLEGEHRDREAKDTIETSFSEVEDTTPSTLRPEPDEIPSSGSK